MAQCVGGPTRVKIQFVETFVVGRKWRLQKVAISPSHICKT